MQGGGNQNLRWTVIKANCVLQHEKDGDIVIKQIPGTAQIADMLTKALDRKAFEQFRNKILSHS
jgi:hypothetical protein